MRPIKTMGLIQNHYFTFPSWMAMGVAVLACGLAVPSLFSSVRHWPDAIAVARRSYPHCSGSVACDQPSGHERPGGTLVDVGSKLTIAFFARLIFVSALLSVRRYGGPGALPSDGGHVRPAVAPFVYEATSLLAHGHR